MVLKPPEIYVLHLILHVFRDRQWSCMIEARYYLSFRLHQMAIMAPRRWKRHAIYTLLASAHAQTHVIYTHFTTACCENYVKMHTKMFPARHRKTRRPANCFCIRLCSQTALSHTFVRFVKFLHVFGPNSNHAARRRNIRYEKSRGRPLIFSTFAK